MIQKPNDQGTYQNNIKQWDKGIKHKISVETVFDKYCINTTFTPWNMTISWNVHMPAGTKNKLFALER